MNKSVIKEKSISLLKQMTLKEKIGQLYQATYFGAASTGPEFDNSDTLKYVHEGLAGSILGLSDNKVIYALQKEAVENSRLHIPLIFCNDIIHGCKTMFPVPLGMSSSWNPHLIEESCKVAAYESSHSGVHLTFSPMLDLVRDPRWGRVVESNGEDPYLSSEIAKAYVKGYQQGDVASENSIAACAKHFVGYGACVGGRDYDSVDMSETTLFNFYLPPYREAIKNDVKMVMSSFNTYNNVPVHGNKYLLRKVLRDKLKFKQVVVSDYAGVYELTNHKQARDARPAAKLSINAGVDIEMVSTCYLTHLESLVETNEVDVKTIDEAVLRILELKYEMGLFDNPYQKIYFNDSDYFLKDNALDVSRKMANESIILLENDGLLPLKKKQKVLYVGPFVDNKNVSGSWMGKGDNNQTLSIKEVLDNEKYQYYYLKGCDIKNNKYDLLDIPNDIDSIVYTVGEDSYDSGESKSKAHLKLPAIQDEVLNELLKLNKKIILICFAGRPLILTKYKKLFDEGKISGIIYCYWLGTMSGKAIVDTLYGKNNPSGKASMTFLRSVGQAPLYYNRLSTGRPHYENQNNDYRLRYIDEEVSPLYPFGYGKSYSCFSYDEVKTTKNILTKKDKITVSTYVTNDSNIGGKEIVELYIECLYSSLSRPLKELKGFKKIYLKPHEKKLVSFTLSCKDFAFYDQDKLTYESSEFKIYLGCNSDQNNYCLINFINK